MTQLENFLQHPFIQEISMNPYWTISDPTDKKPLDIALLMSESKIVGASFNDGNNPLTTLPAITGWFEQHNMIPQNASYHLRAANEAFANKPVHAILDIEPNCPDDIKNKLLSELPWDYAEISLSGRGLHLGLILPCDIKMNFKKLSVLKHPDKYYEILLNQKFCTFTMNMLNQTPPLKDKAALTRLSDFIIPLYDKWIEKQTERQDMSIKLQAPDIPEKDFIERFTVSIQFGRDISEYGNDLSRYEFAYACFILYKIRQIIKVEKLKHINYTPEQITWLVYRQLQNALPWRAKHDETRDGLPWLLYQAREACAKLGNATISHC